MFKKIVVLSLLVLPLTLLQAVTIIMNGKEPFMPSVTLEVADRTSIPELKKALIAHLMSDSAHMNDFIVGGSAPDVLLDQDTDLVEIALNNVRLTNMQAISELFGGSYTYSYAPLAKKYGYYYPGTDAGRLAEHQKSQGQQNITLNTPNRKESVTIPYDFSKNYSLSELSSLILGAALKTGQVQFYRDAVIEEDMSVITAYLRDPNNRNRIQYEIVDSNPSSLDSNPSSGVSSWWSAVASSVAAWNPFSQKSHSQVPSLISPFNIWSAEKGDWVNDRGLTVAEYTTAYGQSVPEHLIGKGTAAQSAQTSVFDQAGIVDEEYYGDEDEYFKQ